jgi:hypothetical protein
MPPTVLTVAERPDLSERADEATATAFPEWNLHGDVLSRLWTSLYDIYPDFQLVLWDEEHDEVLGEGNTIPCTWDGTVGGLPPGIDDVVERGLAAGTRLVGATTLCALNIIVVPGHRGGRLSSEILDGMKRVAAGDRFTDLIAPVRPSWKERYPLTPIERYVTWTREGGLPFDPWIRIHVRLGGEILAPAPRSLRITGTVEEWERWTGMRFPESGEYLPPGALAPLHIDSSKDLGEYSEPNVWMRHLVRRVA